MKTILLLCLMTTISYGQVFIETKDTIRVRYGDVYWAEEMVWEHAYGDISIGSEKMVLKQDSIGIDSVRIKKLYYFECYDRKTHKYRPDAEPTLSMFNDYYCEKAYLDYEEYKIIKP